MRTPTPYVRAQPSFINKFSSMDSADVHPTQPETRPSSYQTCRHVLVCLAKVKRVVHSSEVTQPAHEEGCVANGCLMWAYECHQLHSLHREMSSVGLHGNQLGMRASLDQPGCGQCAVQLLEIGCCLHLVACSSQSAGEEVVLRITRLHGEHWSVGRDAHRCSWHPAS